MEAGGYDAVFFAVYQGQRAKEFYDRGGRHMSLARNGNSQLSVRTRARHKEFFRQ